MMLLPLMGEKEAEFTLSLSGIVHTATGAGAEARRRRVSHMAAERSRPHVSR